MKILDILLKLAPIGALFLAYQGLDTWKRQIKGTEKYKVASDLLLAAYRLREGIALFRSPFIQFVPTNDASESQEMNEFYGFAKTMEDRWKEVYEPITSLSLMSLKAEVHLGKKIKPPVDGLFKLARELQVTYEQYLDVKRPNSGFNDNDFDASARAVLWAKPTKDNFKNNVLKHIEEIEELTRKYL